VTVLADGSRCGEPGTEVDHIIPMADDHSLEALQLLCTYHHGQKTGREASAVAHTKPPRARPAEAHPGLIN
jgi:5-methylcytosine-specific restriction endonuclease McrA